jgi:hypothetical protein
MLGLRQARSIRVSLPKSGTDDSRQFVFSELVNAISDLQTRTFSRHCRKLPPGHTEFHDIRDEMFPIVAKIAQEVAESNCSQMHSNSCVAIDGTWNHKRQAYNHIIGLTDCPPGTIADLTVVTQLCPFIKRNHGENANGVNVFGLRETMARWRNNARGSHHCKSGFENSAEVRELG